MTVNDMRRTIVAKYADTIRGRRVDCMPDSQVIAIYRNLVERRALPGPGVPKRRRLHEPVRCEQMRMDI